MQNILEKYEAHFQELSIPFTYEIEEGVVVNGDIVRIEQVVQNIINNAIKYGKLSPVHVSLRKSESSAAWDMIPTSQVWGLDCISVNRLWIPIRVSFKLHRVKD